MKILMMGLHYKTAPVEIRERFAFKEEEKNQAIQALHECKNIQECVIVNTCNRMEIYAVVDQLHTGRHDIKTFLSHWFDIPKEAFMDYLDVKEEDDALRHLFRVICGLDSMVLGETQILGQIRQSFLFSQEAQATGVLFNHLFPQAIRLAKRAHSETTIGKQAVSVSYAAVELAKKIFGNLEQKNVLIVGAGKMSKLTGKHLHAQGVPHIHVVNRTYNKACQIAQAFQGTAYPWGELSSLLMQADIVISSTGASHYVITPSMMQWIHSKRHHRPLFLVDIAVPRDIDPSIHDMENIFLYDIDDLQGVVDAHLEERAREAEKIGYMIGEAIGSFKAWVNTLGVVPLITALREKSLRFHEESMRQVEHKLPHLTEKELRIIRKYSKTLVNQLLHDPLVRIKEMAAASHGEEAVAVFVKLFALEEALQKQEREHLVKEESTLLRLFALRPPVVRS